MIVISEYNVLILVLRITHVKEWRNILVKAVLFKFHYSFIENTHMVKELREIYCNILLIWYGLWIVIYIVTQYIDPKIK